MGEPSGEAAHVPVGAVPETFVEAGRNVTVGFDELYRSAYVPVLRLAYALSGSWTIAEEVAQETFLRAFGRLERLSNAEGWVRHVAANLARSRMRRLGAEVRAVGRLAARPVSPAPESDLLPAEFDGFWSQVRALPRRQAQAVALHYLEDRPVHEVAALMGCSESTVKALLHQARQRLAQRLGDREVDA